jgi:hypothetical protein
VPWAASITRISPAAAVLTMNRGATLQVSGAPAQGSIPRRWFSGSGSHEPARKRWRCLAAPVTFHRDPAGWPAGKHLGAKGRRA